MQKALDDTRLRLADLEHLREKLDEFNMKVASLEAEMDKLKLNMTASKKVSIVNFKESNSYKLMLNTVAHNFLPKKG